MCILANQLGAKHAWGFLVLSVIQESRDMSSKGKAYEVWSECEPCNVALSVADGGRASQKEATRWRDEGGGRERERTGVESGLTAMAPAAERGDGLTENTVQISKILLPAKITVLVDVRVLKEV